MQAILGILFCVFFSMRVSAAEVELPEHPCNGRECSARMQGIVDNFKLAHAVEELTAPVLNSGECFHVGFGYSPSDTQHGVVYLAKKPDTGEMHFSGSFAFFFETNPYADWTLGNISEKVPDPYRKAVEKVNDYTVAEWSTPDTLWVYFVRQDQVTGYLYLIGYWGAGHMLTCELRPNGSTSLER